MYIQRVLVTSVPRARRSCICNFQRLPSKKHEKAERRVPPFLLPSDFSRSSSRSSWHGINVAGDGKINGTGFFSRYVDRIARKQTEIPDERRSNTGNNDEFGRFFDFTSLVPMFDRLLTDHGLIVRPSNWKPCCLFTLLPTAEEGERGEGSRILSSIDELRSGLLYEKVLQGTWTVKSAGRRNEIEDFEFIGLAGN